jgi:hypothetical protein
LKRPSNPPSSPFVKRGSVFLPLRKGGNVSPPFGRLFPVKGRQREAGRDFKMVLSKNAIDLKFEIE